MSLAHQALTQFLAESRNNPLGEDESRAILRRVLGIPGEGAVSRQADARRRLGMLARLNASNECLRRSRVELGPNAHAVLSAIEDLSSHARLHGPRRPPLELEVPLGLTT